MKNKYTYIGLLGLLLAGCTANNSSSQNISPSSSFSESSSLEISSSEDPRGPEEYELTTKMIREFQEGYRVDGIYTAYVKDEVYYTNCYEYNCTDTVYEFTQYEEVAKNPTKKKAVSSYRYEGYDFGTDTKYLTQAKLNLNNEVAHYLVTDGYGSLLPWYDTGFANVFNSLKPEYFVETENNFEFSLDLKHSGVRSCTQALVSQFSSYMGLSMTSFKIKTDGYSITDYFMDFQPLASSVGQMYITVEGKFTMAGAEVVQPIQPLEGTSDADFDNIFKELQKQNYRLDVNLGVKSFKLALEDAEKVIYDEYDKNGKKLSSYGYFQVDDTTLQGVTKINDVIYKDAEPGSGSLWNVIPTLEISSVLFDLSEESTPTRKVFTYRKDAPNDIAFYYDYGMLAGSLVGDLTIILENNTVTIKNKLTYSTEEYVYYDIGKVKNLFASYQENCDNLKWSEILSNQEKELSTLLGIIPQEALDQIPTLGGSYSQVTLDANYRTPVIVATVMSTTEGQNLYNSYVSKLIDAGFEVSEEHSTEKLVAYTKESVVNGETKTLCVKLVFAADYLSGMQFVIYPSVI